MQLILKRCHSHAPKCQPAYIAAAVRTPMGHNLAPLTAAHWMPLLMEMALKQAALPRETLELLHLNTKVAADINVPLLSESISSIKYYKNLQLQLQAAISAEQQFQCFLNAASNIVNNDTAAILVGSSMQQQKNCEIMLPSTQLDAFPSDIVPLSIRKNRSLQKFDCDDFTQHCTDGAGMLLLLNSTTLEKYNIQPLAKMSDFHSCRSLADFAAYVEVQPKGCFSWQSNNPEFLKQNFQLTTDNSNFFHWLSTWNINSALAHLLHHLKPAQPAAVAIVSSDQSSISCCIVEKM